MKQSLNTKLSKERVKAILTKRLLEESFYGVLGIHPNATSDVIENGFQKKLEKATSNTELSKILKAYSRLASGYRNLYDDYLKKYREGIERAAEISSEKNISIDDSALQNKIKDKSILPEGVFMQPWATSL